MAAKKKTTKTANPKKDFTLFRSETNKVVGGVCGGLAVAFNIDATLLRILFLVAFIFGGTGFLLYVILWVVIPRESRMNISSNDTIRENIEEMKERATEFTKEIKTGQTDQNNKLIFGLIVVGLGVMLLINNFGFGKFFDFDRLWPLLIIVVGFVILSKRDGR